MIPYAKGAKPNDDEHSEKYDAPAKHADWRHRILLNRPSKVAFIGLCFSVVGPILIYVYIFYPSIDVLPSDGFSTGSCLVPRSSRLPCGPFNETESDCHSQCCYDFELNACFHRFPSRFTYIVDGQWVENMTLTPRVQNSPFQSQQNFDIKILFDEISSTHLALTFQDANESTHLGNKLEEKDYSYQISTPELNIAVNDTYQNVIFDTVRGPIMAAENIWEIVFKVTDEAMYGLGDIPLREGAVKVLYNHMDGWIGIPLIFSKANGTFHGLLIDVIEPTELIVLGRNQIALRSLAKKAVKLHLFTGPEPKDIMKDVVKWMGYKPHLEYWMLGLHICSDILDSNTHEDLEDFLKGAAEENIPFESHCGVRPVVFQNDKCNNDTDDSNDKSDEVTKGATIVKSFNKRFVPHVSPYIHFIEPNTSEDNTDIVEQRIMSSCSNIIESFQGNLLKTSNDTVYKGIAKDDMIVFYPDYESAGEVFITELWGDVEIDGVLLENSWPLDLSWKNHSETYKILPYLSQYVQEAFNYTPQWNVMRPGGEVYMYSHNQYGNNFANAFRFVSQDMPLWTTSQWLGNDIVTRQNVTTSWSNLQRMLTETALGGISGNWLWSTPICGDTEHYDSNTHTHLCMKWYQTSTYLPLIRVHSKEAPRHPLSFTGNHKANVITALNNRLSLLPYFFTTLQEGPLLRPMFYQFPSSETLSNLTSQFSVGEDLVIVPNLLPSQSHVHLYMPPGKWYELWSGLPLNAEEGDVVTMTTTDADFLVLVRAGAILAMQKTTKATAEATRLSSEYSITIALQNIVNNGSYTKNEEVYLAEGKVYMTEDMTLHFKASDTKLNIGVQGDDYKAFCENATWAREVSDINVFGLDEKYNNYDNLMRIRVNLDLCLLQGQDEIVYDFIN